MTTATTETQEARAAAFRRGDGLLAVAASGATEEGLGTRTEEKRMDAWMELMKVLEEGGSSGPEAQGETVRRKKRTKVPGCVALVQGCALSEWRLGAVQ